ncbi:hypothetical protein B5F77_10455 [Parabacteroides sp. An277]|nr:hypothetical protein B5F77_10455 [Parabacteroides sp. An277]
MKNLCERRAGKFVWAKIKFIGPVEKRETPDKFSIFRLKTCICRLKIYIFKLKICIFNLKIENLSGV